jgi:hypothetical protein
MSSMVWPCFAARVPMAVAMLPEPMMLMVVMTCACSLVGYGSVGRGGLAGVLGRGVEGSPGALPRQTAVPTFGMRSARR